MTKQEVRALKSSFRDVRLMAAGGVNQNTAADDILAGANVLGIGRDLNSRRRDPAPGCRLDSELARRYSNMVGQARVRLEERVA